jgi:DNA end-binding protein Ku
VILRETQHLAALEVIDHALVLSLLRFADELAVVTELALPAEGAMSKPELAMAKALVETLSTTWKPERYTDEYRDNLLRIIKGKAKGKKVHLAAEETPRKASVIDLMERLRQSLEEHKRTPETPTAKTKRRVGHRASSGKSRKAS